MTQSKRTGGPKTPEGKRVSAHNALKTGAYTSLIILPGESEQDFQQLEDQFIHDFVPQDIVGFHGAYVNRTDMEAAPYSKN